MTPDENPNPEDRREGEDLGLLDTIASTPQGLRVEPSVLPADEPPED